MQQRVLFYPHGVRLQLRRDLCSSTARVGLRKVAVDIKRMSQLPPDIEEAHRVAVANRKDTYIDPRSGLTVFTSLAAEKRGKCCGRACRHCPYGHFNVPDNSNRKAPLPKKPTLLRAPGKKSQMEGMRRRILFWSGGKDSFLTLLKLLEEDPGNDVTLLTTFDSSSGDIPEQNIPLTDVFDQARALNVDVCVVPLREGKDGYMLSVLDGIRVIESAGDNSLPTRLYFGDLHLEDIRSWRENKFAQANYVCGFPIFKVPYAQLVDTMYGSVAGKLGARYFFSAVNNPDVGFKVGDEITREVMENHLMKCTTVDPFGESGEFHTVVRLGT